MAQKEKYTMKTANLSSEKNGITLAVKTKSGKAVYATPDALREILENGPALLAELNSVDADELGAIQLRASQTPEARKAASVQKRREELQAAVSNTVAGTPQRQIAELEIQAFELKQSL